jgi:hypothetical protein
MFSHPHVLAFLIHHIYFHSFLEESSRVFHTEVCPCIISTTYLTILFSWLYFKSAFLLFVPCPHTYLPLEIFPIPLPGHSNTSGSGGTSSLPLCSLPHKTEDGFGCALSQFQQWTSPPQSYVSLVLAFEIPPLPGAQSLPSELALGFLDLPLLNQDISLLCYQAALPLLGLVRSRMLHYVLLPKHLEKWFICPHCRGLYLPHLTTIYSFQQYQDEPPFS